LLLSVLLSYTWSYAATDAMRAPLSVPLMHPIMMRFLNPTPVSAFDMSNAVTLEQNYASLNMFDVVPNGQFIVDTELYVPTIQVRQRISKQHLMRARLSLYRPYNGILDNFLKNYHQLVGFPNNGREFRPSNQMAYALRPEWSSQNRWEIGNIELELQSQIYKNHHLAVAILSTIQLPTASKKRGWSSGGTDFSLGATFSWYGNKYFTHAELRAIRVGATSTPSLAYQPYFRSSLTLGRELSSHYTALIQLQGGSSPYQSSLFVLSQNPWVLRFGLRVQGNTAIYSYHFTENLTQYTTADFSFGFNVRWLID